MNRLNGLRTVLAVAVVPWATIGCAVSPDEAEQARLQTSTPLPHDPTDKFEIGPWWSDGEHLINLRPDGGYSIYADNNRYTRAIDRGRWGQQNYATMWLEPYTGLEPQRIRVAITRIDGRIALQPPKFGTMFAVAAPPPVMEDQLIGDWRGSMGTLRLSADSTYAFVPAIGAMTDDGRVAAGHNGRWVLNGATLTLSPTTPSVAAPSLRVRHVPREPTSNDETAHAPPVLEGLGGELARITANSQ